MQHTGTGRERHESIQRHIYAVSHREIEQALISTFRSITKGAVRASDLPSLKLEIRFSEEVNRFIALVLGDLHSAIDKEL